MRGGIRFVLLLTGAAGVIWLAAFGLRALIWDSPDDDLAERREEPTFDFLEYLGPEHDNILFVADPVVAARRFRRVPAFRSLIGDPEERQAEVPSGLMVATNDELFVSATRMNRLATLIELCEGAGDAGERSLELELPKLQSLIAEDLEALRVPDLVVWLEFMDEAAVSRQMVKARSAVASLPEWMSLVENSDERIVVSFSVASYFDREGLSRLFRDWSVLRGASDPIESRLVDAAMRLDVVASLRADDNALVVELGPRQDSSSAEGDPPDPELLEDDPEALLAWARWDVSRASELARETDALMDEWRGTAAGKAWQDGDPYGGAADLALVLRTVQTLGGRGELRIDLRDDGIHAEAVVDDAPAAKPIANGTLAKVVPRRHAAVHLSTTDSLADVLLDAMVRFERNLFRDEMRAEREGDEEASRRLEKKVSTYYEDLRAVRQRLIEDSAAYFQPGFALVLGDRDNMGTVHLEADDREMTTRIPAIAIVGKPRRMKDAMAWVESVANHVALGLRREKTSPLVSRKNLSLRGPTRIVNLDWVLRLRSGTKVRAGRDVQLHYFAYDEYLVISTSPELSREIIRADAPGVTVPPRALSYGSFSGSKFGELLEASFGEQSVFEVIEAIDSVTWEAFDDDGRRRTAIHAGF